MIESRTHWRICVLIAVAVVSAAPARSPPPQARTQTSVLASFDFRRGAAAQQHLPRALQEISGLATTSDGRVFAHADERGEVSEVDPCAGAVTKSFSLGKPAVRADLEGIAIVGERFFLVSSTGQLYETREGRDGAAVPFAVFDTGFGKVCEVEGLAFDPGERVLLMGCKQSSRPELRGQITVLRWSLDKKAAAIPPSLTIPLGEVIKRSGNRGFRTSGIERDARSGHYVLVAGPERALIEVTGKGLLVAIQPLQRQLHPQPESVTFLADSVLVVGDEGGTSRGVITCYRRGR